MSVPVNVKGKDMLDASKISVQLKLDSDLHAWLVQEAKRRRSSLAYILRMLINDAMKVSIKKGEHNVEEVR
jgi:hypothetical protein